MGTFIDQLGTAAAGTIANIPGAILGLALQGSNDRRQIRQQKKLNELDKEMMRYQQGLQLDTWEKTNYSAQKAQMVKAGLNPALLYGMSGGGAATTGGGASGTAGDAPAGGGEIMGMTGLGLQLGLQKAQIENIEADTKLKQATAEKTSGADTAKTETETQSLMQGIENQKAAETLTRVQARLAGIEEKYQNETYDEKVDLIIQSAALAKTVYDREELNKNLDRAQYETKLKLLEAQTAKAALEVSLTAAGIEKTKWDTVAVQATIKKIAADIAQGWAGLTLDERKTKVAEFEAALKAAMPGIGQVMGKFANSFVEALDRIGEAIGGAWGKDLTPKP